ncbi:pleckstrin homology domain-containing family G member 3 isoform X2 [Scophthalmus maximus]|uniref:pleckstrin homology domain-containing family G member 3 isoform X2 n=1 Tax=Scophthalmus maximus TaxID=52904 RepID=UPI001FA88DEE|nr:pleckstrin homology domain-containing family G member 3 isoform X2 [Scophthalmus maximus]
MEDYLPPGSTAFQIFKNWKSLNVISQIRCHLPTSLASSRGLSAMPEGSHSALHQGPMGEESPQLSSPLFTGEHGQANIDLGPDCYSRLCAEPLDGEGERPVSLVSTLSSDSSRDSRSLFGSTIALPSSTTPPIQCGEDIDLELSPAEGSGGQAGDQSPTLTSSRGHWQDRPEPKVISNQRNNNNAASNRKASADRPHLPAPPVVTDAMAPNPKLTYVDRVVMEIIETERMYVKDLRSIVEDYLAHIIDMSDLPIRPEQVCSLFGNIEDIYEFNSELLQSLDMCENDPVAVARCFVDKSEYFEIYTQYCTNYPNSVAALTDCMRSKTLAKFFRDRQAALRRSLPLGSFLLKPVQRILKYHLLLQEIAKHFGPDEEGYEVVQEAIDTMTGVAWYINDMKRKHEHAVRVQEIQSLLINWKGPDLTTYGELVLEGTFHVLRAKNTRTLFLFERMLLITKKRGEHYVYKIHISCATLMLLDSAKDPLLFSVIHFKHPKQPHTAQAKSVEEKRLWAHHIKRLILENHNTIVPQKAKDAIQDNSNYLGKYQYSPERLSKAESCQADDFHLGGRKGRRRSEPAKQIIRSTKAVLKHADSEGALLGDRCSLQPATGVSTLASSLGEAQAERPCVDDPTPTRDSPVQLSPTDSGPNLGSSPSEVGLQPEKAKKEEEEEEGESYKEDILMGDDQVADFANSVLAAISCWHYRARALLSTHFTTDDHNRDVTEVKATQREEADTRRQEEKQVDVKEALTTQVNAEELCPLDCVPQAEKSDQLEPRCPESPVSPAQQDAGSPEPQITRETGEEEEGGSDSSGLHVEETSLLTNGELSEEEEDVLAHKSILPSSVLDQASVIAEHFISNLSRRSSLVSEDLGSLACPSPPVENEVFKSSSACMDLETQAQLENSTPEPQATSEANLSTPAHEPALDALMEGEQRSTLSKQDRLLIHKIRRYYEHAEDQDANFSIKRRESLSYIPAGLVRHLSRQLNSVPQEQAAPVHRKGLSRNRPTSWSVFDLPGLEKSRNTETRQKAEPQRAVEAKTGPQSVSEASTAEEEFRSSSDMLKVWQDMEMEEESQAVPQTEEEDVHDSRLEATQDTSIDTSDVKTSEQPPQILEESEICIASEGSSISSPSAISAATDGGSGQECKPSATPAPQEKNHVNQGQLPKLISFRASIDEDQILQDMGKMKNKVFQLARQYSQRIKNNRPIVWPRNRETANHQGFKNMPAVHEEKAPLRKKGKPNLRLPLTACEEMVIHEVRSPSPVQTPSSQSTVPCPQSPQSPQSPQPETFHWPHVQELRSKYTGPCHPSNATCSCALGVLECCRSVCDSCSHKYNSSSDLHRALTDCPRTHSERCAVVEDWPQAQPRLQPLLCRWSSLDHMLGSLPLHEVQNLQDPVRTCKLPERDILPQDELDCAERMAVPSSGKMSESHLVKSLREKFQSLGTSS